MRLKKKKWRTYREYSVKKCRSGLARNATRENFCRIWNSLAVSLAQSQRVIAKLPLRLIPSVISFFFRSPPFPRSARTFFYATVSIRDFYFVIAPPPLSALIFNFCDYYLQFICIYLLFVYCDLLLWIYKTHNKFSLSLSLSLSYEIRIARFYLYYYCYSYGERCACSNCLYGLSWSKNRSLFEASPRTRAHLRAYRASVITEKIYSNSHTSTKNLVFLIKISSPSKFDKKSSFLSMKKKSEKNIKKSRFVSISIAPGTLEPSIE